MKKLMILFVICFVTAGAVNGQKWTDLTDEQKNMKLQEFRDDNQNYLKNTLKMTEQQRADIDAVNLCFLSQLDLIDRYGKDDAGKEKAAKTAVQARNSLLDGIMGADNRKKFQEYVQAKLKKAAPQQ
jgi:hypothetical protein